MKRIRQVGRHITRRQVGSRSLISLCSACAHEEIDDSLECAWLSGRVKIALYMPIVRISVCGAICHDVSKI